MDSLLFRINNFRGVIQNGNGFDDLKSKRKYGNPAGVSNPVNVTPGIRIIAPEALHLRFGRQSANSRVFREISRDDLHLTYSHPPRGNARRSHSSKLRLYFRQMFRALTCACLSIIFSANSKGLISLSIF